MYVHVLWKDEMKACKAIGSLPWPSNAMTLDGLLSGPKWRKSNQVGIT